MRRNSPSIARPGTQGRRSTKGFPAVSSAHLSIIPYSNERNKCQYSLALSSDGRSTHSLIRYSHAAAISARCDWHGMLSKRAAAITRRSGLDLCYFFLFFLSCFDILYWGHGKAIDDSKEEKEEKENRTRTSWTLETTLTTEWRWAEW